MPVTILRSRNGLLDAADAAAFADLRTRLASGPKKVLLHLHGGLVPQASGEAVATALSGTDNLSFNAPADYEQIYVVWRTGAFETIRTNWTDLFHNDRLYQALFKKLIGFVASKLGAADGSGRSVGMAIALSPAEIETRLSRHGDAPFADLDALAAEDSGSRAVEVTITTDFATEQEFKAVLLASKEFNDAVDDIGAAVSWDLDGRSVATPHGDAALGCQSLARLHPTVRSELEKVPAVAEARALLTSAELLKALVKHAVAIAMRVIKRLRAGRGHGVHATIVEEIARELYGDLIGATIWGMMTEDAADHFGANKLGSALVDLLAGSQHRLIVTGHSAGSIWASALMIEAASRQNFPKFDLILLAPAVRAKRFAEALTAAGTLIDRFRIFTMGDDLERADPVLGKGTGMIYPSSLLYLVSGLFEEEAGAAAPDAPLVGMQRFIARDPAWLKDAAEEAALNTVRTFLTRDANSVVYAKSNNGPGLGTDATSHGDFDNNPLTLASVHSFL